MANCKPGDLAVVIQAQHEANLGRIVTVLEVHDRTGPLVYNIPDTVWLTESTQPMMWTINAVVYMLKRGPIPDALVQPIRSQPAAKSKRARQIKMLEVV